MLTATATVALGSSVVTTTAIRRGTAHSTTHATHITVGTGRATATATTSTATVSRALTSNVLEEGWDFLVGLLEQLDEVTDNTAVSTVEESSRDTGVSSTTGTTDTVNIVVNVGWQIIVDHMGDIGNVESTGSNSGSHQDGAAAVTEVLKGTLTLTLSAVTVNGSGWEVLVDEEFGQRISHTLGLDENECQSSAVSVQDVKQDGAFIVVLNILDLLGDVLGSGTDTADGKEDVVLQEITGEHLDVAWEGGREHEGLTASNWGHVFTFDNAADLRLETHVKHTISLIKDKVLDVAERDAATLNQVDKTAGSGKEKVTTTLNLAKLGANISSSIDNTRANPGAVSKLPSLIVDLRDKLTGRSQDERGRVSLALTAVAKLTALLSGSRGGSVLECLRKDWEQETTSLSGTSLGTGHQVAASHDNRDGILLDRSRHLVGGEFDVGDQMVVQRRVGEGADGLGDILAGSLDGDIIVVGEVDTGMLLAGIVGDAEEFAFETSVRGTGNVLSITPLAITRASGSAAAAVVSALLTLMAWVTVSMWIESTTGAGGLTPARITIHGRTATRTVVSSTPPRCVIRGSISSLELAGIQSKFFGVLFEGYLPWSPGACVHASRAAVLSGSRTVSTVDGRASGRLSGSSLTSLTTEVRRNVGGASGLVWRVLGVVEGEVSDFQVISHINCSHQNRRLARRLLTRNSKTTEHTRRMEYSPSILQGILRK